MASLGFRIPLAIIFGVVLDKGLMGLGIAAPAASLGAGTLLFIYYILASGRKARWCRNRYHDILQMGNGSVRPAFSIARLT